MKLHPITKRIFRVIAWVTVFLVLIILVLFFSGINIDLDGYSPSEKGRVYVNGVLVDKRVDRKDRDMVSLQVQNNSTDYILYDDDVYRIGSMSKNGDMIVPVMSLLSADAESFEIIDEQYSKDRRRVFRYFNEIVGADSETFEVIKAPYSKDKYGVFRYEHRMRDTADPESFMVEDFGNYDIELARDEDTFFYWGSTISEDMYQRVLNETDPDTLRRLESHEDGSLYNVYQMTPDEIEQDKKLISYEHS